MNNQANTQRGIDAENLFANTILDNSHAFKAMCESLSIAANAEAKQPEVIGGNHRKTDVEIAFKDTNISSIRVSIKRFKGNAGYNHLERRRFSEFCKRNQFSNADRDFLKSLWLRKAANSKKQDLVEENEKEEVRKIFSKVEPATSGILGNDHPQMLALYNANISRWHIYNIQNQVLSNIRNSVIEFTSVSSNIAIGNYIVIQRKGSNKGESGNNPLTNIDHGANDVQIKMRVKKFFNEVEPLASYEV